MLGFHFYKKEARPAVSRQLYVMLGDLYVLIIIPGTPRMGRPHFSGVTMLCKASWVWSSQAHRHRAE